MFKPDALRPKVRLEPLKIGDAEFLLELLNTPQYIEYVGDRGVKSITQARTYIEDYFLAAQAENGFGYFTIYGVSDDGDGDRDGEGVINQPAGTVAEINDQQPVGLVGLMKRDFLDLPDIGFALLPQFFGLGYAQQGCQQLMLKAHDEYQLPKIQAFTSPENLRSQTFLERLGFELIGDLIGPNDEKLLMYLCVINNVDY